MLVQNDDILQFTLEGTLQGEAVLNVFHYRVFTTQPSFVNMDSEFIDWGSQFDSKVVNNFSNALSYNLIRAVNLSNPVQIYDSAVAYSGGQTGENLPVHDTMSVKLIRTTGITRNGRKSFSGIPEALTQNGTLNLASFNMTDIYEFLSQPIVVADADDPLLTLTLNPVIVGRTKDVNGVYQLDLNKINVIKGAQANTLVRTQNTRKR